MIDRQHYSIILMGLAILLFAWVQPSYAQTPESSAAPVIPPDTAAPPPAPAATAVPLELSTPGVAEVTFAQLHQPAFELRSPVDQQSFVFQTPYRWTIAEGNAYLTLHYDMQYESHDPASQSGAVNVAISVYFNDSLLTTFIPTEGTDQRLQIVIPATALATPGQNQHRLRFVHLSGDCDNFFERALFVVHDDSFIHFDYSPTPLEINLAHFPRPLIQDLFTPESILLVIPDEYSQADLAAAASVAATLGHHAFYQVNLDIITASEATPERLAHTSAVVIGQPRANTFLLDLYQRNRLPTTLTADGSLIANSATQPILPEDGILQEVVSDFSPDHVYLIVTGASQEAVTQAARALSVLAPRYGFDGDLVVISEFREIDSEGGEATNTFTLADLGLRDTNLQGIEANSASARFFIPANWRFTEKPTLLLSYTASGELEPSGSSLTVHLNDKPIGSIPIDSTLLGERQAVIELPPDDLKPGVRNRLSFEANLNMQLPRCALPELDSSWIRINENSQLRLPHIVAAEENLVASLDDPLTPFASRQDLSDVWLSLSENPGQEELVGMVRVAAWLGNFSDGPGFAPRVSVGGIDGETQLEQYHVIAFGRPSTNPLIAQINDNMPQPFMPGEDDLRQQVGNVVYHLPDQFSLGLLQALPAPWNPGRKVMLVITGTTPEGLNWAANALTGEETYYQLKGDLAFIRTDRIESFSSAKFIRSPMLAGVEAVADEGEEVVLQATSTLTPTSAMSVSLAVGLPETANQDSFPKSYSLPNPLSSLTSWLILGLIGAGLAVAVIGININQRRAKTR